MDFFDTIGLERSSFLSVLKASRNLIKRGPSGTNIFPDNNQLISMTWSRTHSIQVLFHLSFQLVIFLLMQIFKTFTVKVQKKLTYKHARGKSWSGQVSHLPLTSHYTATTEPQRSCSFTANKDDLSDLVQQAQHRTLARLFNLLQD